MLIATHRRDIVVNYDAHLVMAIRIGCFSWARMLPLIANTREFAPRFRGTARLTACFSKIVGSPDISEVNQQVARNLAHAGRARPAKDIREILALGPMIYEGIERHLAFIAPDIVPLGDNNMILKLDRFPEWMGVFRNTWEPPHDSFAETEIVTFMDHDE